MREADRLRAVVDDGGFSRLRRYRTRRGVERWEMWFQDGVLHVLDGHSWLDCVAQAEQFIARRP
jgi:hypothetical protein